MAKPALDKQLAAQVVADAIRYNVATAADRNGVNPSTVHNYKNAVAKDEKLRELVQENLVKHTQDFEPDLYRSIRVTLERLNTEPDTIQRDSLLKQLSKLMEIHFANEQWRHVLANAANSLTAPKKQRETNTAANSN